MKSKYYPFVTVVGAGLVAGLPVLVLWTSLSTDEQSMPFVNAEPSARHSIGEPQIDVSTPARSPRVAMSSTPEVRLPIEPHRLETNHTAMKERPEPTRSAESVVESVPAPVDPADEVMPEVLDSVAELAMADLADSQSASPEMADSELDSMPEIPQRPIVSDTYYDATGHLALSSQPLVPDAAMIRPAKDATDPVSEKGDIKKSSEGRRTRKQKKDESTATEPNRQNPANITSASQLPEGPIEDVAIQTPLETQPVGRVENVVAITRAQGWPVALIKSDLPDDVWWVQQMVGIQGTSFNARVNFGNEYSISGTRYHLVIVFLDSPDEVRRFRIAKQFKDIPAGVRRSREFHYIRN